MWFYLRRLGWTDPFLLLLTTLALPSLLIAARRKNPDPSARLLLAWLTVSVGALLSFHFHNLPYALFIMPALALTATTFGPLSAQHRRKLGLVVLCMALMAKLLFPYKPGGLSLEYAKPSPAAAVLRSYVNLGRSNDLILVDAGDFYASTLPLPSVRYYFFDPGRTTHESFPHYWYLGIIVSLEDFEHLQELRPTYAARLKAWGLNSTAPVATSIVSTSEDGLLRLLRACPHTDFYIPARDLSIVRPYVGITHRTMVLADRALLLALKPSSLTSPKWTMPPDW